VALTAPSPVGDSSSPSAPPRSLSLPSPSRPRAHALSRGRRAANLRARLRALDAQSAARITRVQRTTGTDGYLSDTLLLSIVGTQPVEVSSVRIVDEESPFGEGAASSFELQTDPLPRELLAGAPMEIRITYVPTSQEMRRAVLIVSTNGDDAPEVRVTLIAKILSSTHLEHVNPFRR
jgi:hypothetical protein